MDPFYFIVLTIAVVFLILILTFFGILMSRQNLTVYPPILNPCPDTWMVSADGSSCVIPVEPSGVNIGIPGSVYTDASSNTLTSTFQSTPGLSSNKKMIDFSSTSWNTGSYAGLTLTCAHKKWASQFGVNWDTVSNYNSCD